MTKAALGCVKLGASTPRKTRRRLTSEASLSHQQPDRCPMQISFTPEFASRLEADVGSSHHMEHNPHGGGNTYALETYLDEDLLLTSVGWANSYYQGNDALH